MTVYAFTGHRPSSMPGHEKTPVRELDARLTAFAKKVICNRLYDCTEVVSGLAEGWDMAVADAAVDLGIPLTVAIPFEGQERYWSGYSQARYRTLRALATREHVHGPFPDRSFYLKRDEWMVDICDVLGALWCPEKRTGGTFYTVDYARRWCVPTVQLWQAWIGLH